MADKVCKKTAALSATVFRYPRKITGEGVITHPHPPAGRGLRFTAFFDIRFMTFHETMVSQG